MSLEGFPWVYILFVYRLLQITIVYNQYVVLGTFFVILRF